MKSADGVYGEYERLLSEGKVQKAYRGIIQFMMRLQTRLKAEYPDVEVSAVYPGYMDMTYFSFTPQTLSPLGLKIAIVFLHESFTFRVWLSARNRQLQARFIEILKQADWNPTEISTPGPGVDSIVDQGLVRKPNFEDPQSLADQILTGSLAFSAKVENFLAEQPTL